MRILLTDGSGLTSRQVAGLLARAGHHVGVLTPDPLSLARFTRAVRHVHRVPAFGPDPFAWLVGAKAAYVEHGYDLLFPTQEQVAVLAGSDPLADGIVTVVPSFEALVAVQDKVAARATLERLGLPQPSSVVLATPDALAAWDSLPVFLKTPIGTASAGVVLVEDRAALPGLAHRFVSAGAFLDGGIVAQSPVEGPLVMLQSVFAHGELVAAHANLRVREGAGGGASHKRSLALPEAREMLGRLGQALAWHGALSADAILTADGPVLIDINPRLVEPMNASRSGVDLVGAMLDVAINGRSAPQPPGRADVCTHQLLLAVLGAAQDGRGRRGVAHELGAALRHTGSYRDSVEELTPWGRDWRSPVPLVVASAATLIRPAWWSWFSSGSVTNYALSAEGWRMIRARRDAASPP